MHLSTEHLSNCVSLLASTLQRLEATERQSVDYHIFRNAAIKSFELGLETAGKLMRKALKYYMSNPRVIDEMTYKEVLRHAAKHGLLQVEAVEHWFEYRDNRNNTAHDYGEAFAEETLKLLPGFLQDVENLKTTIDKKLGSQDA